MSSSSSAAQGRARALATSALLAFFIVGATASSSLERARPASSPEPATCSLSSRLGGTDGVAPLVEAVNTRDGASLTSRHAVRAPAEPTSSSAVPCSLALVDIPSTLFSYPAVFSASSRSAAAAASVGRVQGRAFGGDGRAGSAAASAAGLAMSKEDVCSFGADGADFAGEKDGGERARERRWEGWETSTSTVWVTASDEVPDAVTVYTTYGESPAVDGGVITETVYKGASTLTVPGPSYLTITFYPTTTTYATSHTTIPTTTKTKTQSPSQAAASSTPTTCAPGDADEKQSTGLKPTHDQSITLYVIAIFFHSIVGIGIGWNLFLLRDLLYPFKVLTVAVHEMGHVLVTICLGGHIGLFCIDPKVGGLTRQALGDDRELPLPLAALPPGYVMNILVGGVLTFCGFNTLASKIASFILGLCWIGIFLRVEMVAKLMTVLAVGLMIGLWFVDHAWGLRWYILFVGVIQSFYVLWDVADDAFFAKQNPSCPYLHWESQPALSPAVWTLIWLAASFLLFVGFVLAALATWKQSPHAMYCQAQTFLPTR
ncbi:hypothetical protein JCM3775_003995 [Rhodotorula graminis]